MNSYRQISSPFLFLLRSARTLSLFSLCCDQLFDLVFFHSVVENLWFTRCNAPLPGSGAREISRSWLLGTDLTNVHLLRVFGDAHLWRSPSIGGLCQLASGRCMRLFALPLLLFISLLCIFTWLRPVKRCYADALFLLLLLFLLLFLLLLRLLLFSALLLFCCHFFFWFLLGASVEHEYCSAVIVLYTKWRFVWNWIFDLREQFIWTRSHPESCEHETFHLVFWILPTERSSHSPNGII